MSRPELVSPELLAGWRLPEISDTSDKEGRGRVLVAAAGAPVAGATLLTATAALRAGAGKLQILSPRTISLGLALAMPEARVLDGHETPEGELAPEAINQLAGFLERCQSAVIGPGMIDEHAAGELALRIIESGGPAMVVDAAALTGLARTPERAQKRKGELVLTPHVGEMAGLLGCSKAEVEQDSLAAARLCSARLKAVVVLKGADTLIVSPDGASWLHAARQPGLASSGSGDVLAGVIAGLLARGASPAQAAVWGAAAHAEAGKRCAERIAPIGFLARELLEEIAPSLAGLGGA